jgi:hypothetical protein
MSAEFLPPIFISIVGLIFPFVTLSLFFSYINRDTIN